MLRFRPLNLAILMIVMGLLLINSCFCSPAVNSNFRMKKWYTWNNDLEVTKKWYDWQNVPHALQQKRQFDVDDVLIDR
ncbi:unnamed protein product [Caenorhabditis sp. 36 PRJEB53466]|nr:unnamed protein product [Caenorhabditis sp. 36 PRJEB53466]